MSAHSCTASVVASTHRDLILTAAHCISGTAAGLLFVPGYNLGQTPYGVWTVTHAYVDSKWIKSQDPHYDYAILQLAHQQRNSLTVGVQDVTGAYQLPAFPGLQAGATITDIAYNSGINDQPITCTTTVYFTRNYPSFDCHGYVGGSSGSPWLTTDPSTNTTYVQGVLGGLHQGGCYEYTSYSAPFGSNVTQLLSRAMLGSQPDTVPAPGSSGC